MDMKLNLGCGRDIRDGWVNIDYHEHPNIDFVLDLNKDPLPFPSDSVDYILASHVLEHLLYPNNMIDEVHRVLRNGGVFEIRVPYGMKPNMYHVRFFNKYSISPLYQEDGENSLESNKRFNLISADVYRSWRFMRWHLEKYLNIKLKRHNLIGPRFEIIWKLEAIK